MLHASELLFIILVVLPITRYYQNNILQKNTTYNIVAEIPNKPDQTEINRKYRKTEQYDNSF